MNASVCALQPNAELKCDRAGPALLLVLPLWLITRFRVRASAHAEGRDIDSSLCAESALVSIRCFCEVSQPHFNSTICYTSNRNIRSATNALRDVHHAQIDHVRVVVRWRARPGRRSLKHPSALRATKKGFERQTKNLLALECVCVCGVLAVSAKRRTYVRCPRMHLSCAAKEYSLNRSTTTTATTPTYENVCGLHCSLE